MSNFKLTMIHSDNDNHIKHIYRMMKKWAKDYNREDKNGAKSQKLKDIKRKVKERPQQYAVVIDEDTRSKDGVDVCGVVALQSPNVIDVMYVLPQYRGKGVATYAYKTLLNTQYVHPEDPEQNLIDVVAMSIDIDRVIERVDYWRKLGFNCFVKNGSNLIKITKAPVQVMKDTANFSPLNLVSLMNYKSLF